jgi:Fe-S-cluster containining protein
LRSTPHAADAAALNSLEQLCLACGLCCDGTLFDNVRLEPDDDAGQLKALGLPVALSRARPAAAHFPQPCAALCADRSCRVYPHRPKQCRTYECMVFKETQAGRLDPAAALRLVTRARRQADRVRRLLRKLGDADEPRSLGERFHRMQCRMEEKAPDAAALATFADLSLAMHRLKLLAHAKFFIKP